MTGEDIRALSASIDRLNETLRTMYMVKAAPEAPTVSTRCTECGALLQAGVPHSPNCPIGKAQALRARHGR